MVNLLRRVETYRKRKEQTFSQGYQCFPEQPHAHSCLLVFKDFTYDAIKIGQSSGGIRTPFQQAFNQRSSGAQLRASNTLELPFPKALLDNTGLRINGNERDPFVEGIASKVNSFIKGSGDMTAAQIPQMLQGMGASMAKAGGGDIVGAAGNIMREILGTDVTDIASAAQYLLRDKLGSEISRSIDLVTGQTINPRETLAFEGVNLRAHQFSWDLFPNSAADSERIRNIVAMIKRKSLPEVSSLTGIPKAFLQYPSVVDVYLLGVNTDHFIKYKSSMITEFSVDYGAGGGVAIMKGGKPAGVTLSMSMTELEIETAHDYGAENEGRQQEAMSESSLVTPGNGSAGGSIGSGGT